MLRYHFVNREQIPDKLAPGVEYTTEIVKAEIVNDDFIIHVKWIGEIYNPDNPQCMLIAVKDAE